MSKRDSLYLSLPVAAHLARTKLVPNPLQVYDPEHLNEMLNIAAAALSRATRMFYPDPHTGQLRELSLLELEGVVVRRGATRVVLNDGRTIVGVAVLRDELLEGIALLKAAGVPELRLPSIAAAAVPATAEPQDPRAMLAEIEALLQPPLLPSQVQRVSRLAVALARASKRGQVANTAMRLISVLHEQAEESSVRVALASLRAALQDEAKAE